VDCSESHRAAHLSGSLSDLWLELLPMDEPGAPMGLAATRASRPSGLDPTRVALAYVLATTASVIAIYVGIALEPRLGSSAFALLFAPVALAAWYGGLGPGLVATLLC